MLVELNRLYQQYVVSIILLSRYSLLFDIFGVMLVVLQPIFNQQQKYYRLAFYLVRYRFSFT